MIWLVTVYKNLIPHIWLLLVIIGSLGLLSVLSYSTYFTNTVLQLRWKLSKIRNFLLSLGILFLTTILYLAVDTHVVRLPDAIILYAFYILGFTIIFGVKAALIASFISVILIEYYLYEPRYGLYPLHHPENTIYVLVVIGIGMVIGQNIRRYQQKLLNRTEELDQLIKARDQFSAVTAHELKTPLTAISLYSQVLEKQYKNERASKALQDSVHTITRETDKLTVMINDLLDFSRFKSNKFKLSPEVFNFAQLCEERVKIIQALYPNHIYIFRNNTKNATIYADRISLDRLLTNLLTNAEKYTPSKSNIIVILKKKSREFILSVKDQGEGISGEYLEKLFEPFFQVKDGGKGLGLGLHIARTIVELHYGKMWVQSRLNKGTTFFVKLPVNFRKFHKE